MKCKICEKKFKVLQGLMMHVVKSHKLTKKEYYDLYIKKDTEGVCEECNKPTKFISVGQGYLRYCSTKCVANSKLVRNKAKKTSILKYGVENAGGSIESIVKIKQTKLKRYGDENYCNVDEIKQTKLKRYGDENYNNIEKNKETKLKRYGDENYHNVEKMIETKKSLGSIIPEDKIINNLTFKQYKRKVINLTRKIKKELFERWDGFDAYDNEDISQYMFIHYLHKNYPTIDHIIPITHGFLNKISPKVMSDLTNLCITKRKINSLKNNHELKKFQDLFKRRNKEKRLE